MCSLFLLFPPFSLSQLLQFIEVVDTSYICACAPAGGGRQPLTARFKRHFNQIAHTDLEESSLFSIFHTIVENTLNKFSSDIRDLSRSIVTATLNVYSRVSSGLLPTPNKSHYTFNLRDLSGVFQGLLSASARRITTVPAFLRLWIHENRRVFQDRLVTQEDRAWLDSLLSQTLQQSFSIEMSALLPSHVLLFGDYIDGMSGGDARHYAEVTDPAKAVQVMTEALQEYNDENSAMKLVLFADAVEHISRISRILRQPGGNALLLGVGGSGRQSLTRLAAYMSEMEVVTVEMTKHYGLTEFHDDLRKLLLDAGLKEQPTVFLVTDSQLKENMYDSLSNILNSGEVPNLFTAEDQDNIFAACKVACQQKNIPATKMNAYAQFISRVRANLHVVLCMSPLSAAFRTRLRMYPALVNNCVIDYFNDWSDEGLQLVATTTLNEENLLLENVGEIVRCFTSIHRSVAEKSVEYRDRLRRYNYVTPTSYLEVLNVFKFLLAEKRTEVGGLRTKLQYGLDTLAAAGADIAQLQADLREKEPRLIETQKEVELTMQQIAIDRKDAAVTKEMVEKQEAEAAAKAQEVSVHTANTATV